MDCVACMPVVALKAYDGEAQPDLSTFVMDLPIRCPLGEEALKLDSSPGVVFHRSEHCDRPLTGIKHMNW